MKVGNWQIDIEEQKIIWCGGGNLSIGKDEIISNSPSRQYFDMILHFCERSYISENDIFALNSALIYAIEIFNIPLPDGFNYKILIEAQKKIIKDKNDPISLQDEIKLG